MDEIRKKISQLTIRLQFQNKVPLWSLANEHVIYGAAVGEKPVLGPKTRVLRCIMRLAFMVKMSDMMIFCLGLYRAVLVWWAVKKQAAKFKRIQTVKRVFVCFGASSEEYLYADYLKQSQEKTIKVHCLSHAGLHQLGCPKFRSILSVLVKNSFGYTTK